MNDYKEIVSFIKLFTNRLRDCEIDTCIDYIIRHNEPELGFECFIDYICDAEAEVEIAEYDKLLEFCDLLKINRDRGLNTIKGKVNSNIEDCPRFTTKIYGR